MERSAFLFFCFCIQKWPTLCYINGIHLKYQASSINSIQTPCVEWNKQCCSRSFFQRISVNLNWVCSLFFRIMNTVDSVSLYIQWRNMFIKKLCEIPNNLKKRTCYKDTQGYQKQINKKNHENYSTKLEIRNCNVYRILYNDKE